MTLDVSAVRARFPSLHQKTERGQPPVFFDNPAGTQVSQGVIDAVKHYFETMNANSGGAFATSERSDAMVRDTREKVADFLHAPSADEIVIGPNMTTLNFALSRAIARRLSPEDEIVVTRMDHDANVAPWLRVADELGLAVRWVDIRPDDCTLDLDSLEAALTEKTRIVATVHASNAVGTINPVARIAGMARAAGALHIVDAVQSAPHVPIDVQAIGCDFLLCSSYKFFGPHQGILWGRYELLDSLPAYKVRPSQDKPPYRWETGTPAFELISALNATMDYFENIGRDQAERYATQFPGLSGRALALKAAMATLREYEQELVAHLIDMLGTFPGLCIYGITDPARCDERVPTVVFTLDGYTSLEIAAHLAAHGVYVWDGDYYAMEIMNRLGHGQHGMVRVGLAHYNTHDEIDVLESALRKLAFR
jgi:cysteine desulfurase family protein (TIGR01976 family)